jgi:recombinational DNA repair ATPase RecF
MHLTRLALANFRNYDHLELELGQGLTLLQGNNACGKTNLLEAVFYLATARSPHAGAERELIRWGASDEPIPFARVEAEVVRARDIHTNLEILLVQAEDKGKVPARDGSNTWTGRVSKRIKVNGGTGAAIWIRLYPKLIPAMDVRFPSTTR